jgi:hypothetical protein
MILTLIALEDIQSNSPIGIADLTCDLCESKPFLLHSYSDIASLGESDAGRHARIHACTIIELISRYGSTNVSSESSAKYQTGLSYCYWYGSGSLPDALEGLPQDNPTPRLMRRASEAVVQAAGIQM